MYGSIAGYISMQHESTHSSMNQASVGYLGTKQIIDQLQLVVNNTCRYDYAPLVKQSS